MHKGAEGGLVAIICWPELTTSGIEEFGAKYPSQFD